MKRSKVLIQLCGTILSYRTRCYHMPSPLHRREFLQQANCDVAFHSSRQMDVHVQVQLDVNLQTAGLLLRWCCDLGTQSEKNFQGFKSQLTAGVPSVPAPGLRLPATSLFAASPVARALLAAPGKSLQSQPGLCASCSVSYPAAFVASFVAADIVSCLLIVCWEGWRRGERAL